MKKNRIFVINKYSIIDYKIKMHNIMHNKWANFWKLVNIPIYAKIIKNNKL
jgi:hypothetical protein